MLNKIVRMTTGLVIAALCTSSFSVSIAGADDVSRRIRTISGETCPGHMKRFNNNGVAMVTLSFLAK